MKNKSVILLLAACIILTTFFPILSLPLNIIGMIFTKNKVRKTFGILTALSLATIALVWTPGKTMDLYRHHLQLQSLAGNNIGLLGTLIGKELEPGHYLFSFIIAQSGNYDLLQFIVVLLGYSELFWIACDISEKLMLKRSTFVLITLFSFFAVRFIDFASGLWFNLGLINLAVGIYLLYFRHTKYAHYLFFILAASLHVGMILAVMMTLLFSKFRIFRKVRPSVVITIVVFITSFGLLTALLNDILGSSNILAQLTNRMYNSYFTNGEQFESLHSGWNLLLPVANMILGIMVAMMNRKKTDMPEYYSFAIYMSVSMLTFVPLAGVFVRYGFFIAILAVPIIAEILNYSDNRRIKAFIIMSILAIVGVEFARSFIQMESAGLLTQVRSEVTHNLIHLLGGQR